MSTLPDNDTHYQPEDDDVFIPSTHPNEAFSLVHGNADAEQVWILVGNADSDAAVACTPQDVAIYCLDKRELSALPDELDRVEDKHVLVFPHGNAAAEHHIYDALAALGRRCEDEGAQSVKFVTLSTDLTTHMGDRDASACAQRLSRLVSTRTANKPAKLKPKAPTASQQNKAVKFADLEREAAAKKRPIVDVNGDRLIVLKNLVAALHTGTHGESIFNLGGKLAHTQIDNTGATVAELLDEQGLLVLLAESANMLSITDSKVNAAWPESKTLTALFGCQKNFRELRGVAPSPIVRADNTIAQTDGYDEASKVLLDLAGLELNIPEAPTKAEVDDAVHLLVNDWLGDFPFASDADKANVLAFVLTYPLRELVSTVPLAVISAKSKGTGKSKLLSLVVQLFTRATPELDSLPDSEEETRKQITTLLAKAAPFLCFDESPRIGGKSMNRLLTAQTWSDRLLGGNQRVALPNRSVMAATGNNVQVQGDTARRYYPIELFYDGEHPENRPESDFQHPDVEAWTDEHRGELLTAVFTLIRSWQVAGRPKRSTSFGSFERWEAIVGGVLHNAGVVGFLDNLKSHRKAVDFSEGFWTAHLEWLSTKFPFGEFVTRDVVEKMLHRSSGSATLASDAELPQGISVSPTDPDYVRQLGELYNTRNGAWFEGMRVNKGTGKTGGRTRWSIELSPTVQQERAALAAAMLAARTPAQVANNAAWVEATMSDLTNGEADQA